MRSSFFSASFFSLLSMALLAQEDHLGVSVKDSVIEDFLKIDTTYYPPCILPWEPEYQSIGITYNVVFTDSGCHPRGAKKDLEQGKPLIWFPGGIVGCDFSSKADQEFQSRYQVRFVSPGCGRFGDEDPEGYNQVIFQHLDKKYGTGWRNELRQDAEGFVPPATRERKNYSPLAIQLANSQSTYPQASVPETGTSVWWYIIPTSGFALLLALYFVKKKKD